MSETHPHNSSQLKRCQRYEEQLAAIQETQRINKFRAESYILLYKQKLEEYKLYCLENQVAALRITFK